MRPTHSSLPGNKYRHRPMIMHQQGQYPLCTTNQHRSFGFFHLSLPQEVRLHHLRQMQRKIVAAITAIVQSCSIVAEAPLLVRDLECKLAAEVGVTATLPECDGLDEGRLDLFVPTSACDVTLEVDSTKAVVAVLGAAIIQW